MAGGVANIPLRIDHGWFDIFPTRKEALVEDSPVTILEAINERAITRLLVVRQRTCATTGTNRLPPMTGS